MAGIPGLQTLITAHSIPLGEAGSCAPMCMCMYIMFLHLILHLVVQQTTVSMRLNVAFCLLGHLLQFTHPRTTSGFE